MAITYSPKVGEILECDFGKFKNPNCSHVDNNNNYDGRIPPEMIKRRMVVVINGKLDNGCLVVPISSSKDISSINQKMNVPLDSKYFKVTDFYDVRDRWAKSNLIQFVSKKRLFKITDGRVRIEQRLPNDVMTDIQKSIIKSINANSLLQ